jgi:hypothetical protein
MDKWRIACFARFNCCTSREEVLPSLPRNIEAARVVAGARIGFGRIEPEPVPPFPIACAKSEEPVPRLAWKVNDG